MLKKGLALTGIVVLSLLFILSLNDSPTEQMTIEENPKLWGSVPVKPGDGN